MHCAMHQLSTPSGAGCRSGSCRALHNISVIMIERHYRRMAWKNGHRPLSCLYWRQHRSDRSIYDGALLVASHDRRAGTEPSAARAAPRSSAASIDRCVAASITLSTPLPRDYDGNWVAPNNAYVSRPPDAITTIHPNHAVQRLLCECPAIPRRKRPTSRLTGANTRRVSGPATPTI